MTALTIVLVVAQLFTGSVGSSEQHLLGLFNIFNPTSTPATMARNLNSLIGPIRNPLAEDLTLNARASIILDLDSGRILYARNAGSHLPMASITKIMTALVVLDHFGDRLDEVITVPREGLAVTGSRMYLEAGEKITAHNLLRGMLIESANDAAMTFAYEIAGSPDKFAGLMNAKAAELGLKDTNFANPIGFDGPSHYSTAMDLAHLTKVALANKTFSDIVSISKLTVKDVSGKKVHNLVTTNKLLDQYKNVVGVKTGTTTEAGESLVASVLGDSNQKVVVVLLDSPNRFEEGKRALDWALTSYTWIETL